MCCSHESGKFSAEKTILLFLVSMGGMVEDHYTIERFPFMRFRLSETPVYSFNVLK